MSMLDRNNPDLLFIVLNFLKKLELRSNKIQTFENLDSLQNLNFLTLSTNLITSIDKLSYHQYLEELGLFGNYLG